LSAARIYKALLWCYPPEFRNEYGREMSFAFLDELDCAMRSGGFLRGCAVWIRTITELATVAPKEHFHVILQDIRYALRTFRNSPAYAAVVILSLALGIGANTAIFSLMNGVLLSQLPVKDPGQLVMLTDPSASGVSIGSQDGERSLLTYAEFEQLRNHATGFNGLMASQSSLELTQVRIGGGEPEEASHRMVSREYFRVLGVGTAIGRDFAGSQEPVAVISHPYWKRRFGGDPNVIGKSITIRKASLAVAGVAPVDFFGETVAQQPDFWIPLDLQAQVLPGRDWLHDKGEEKVMWLHVFGRLAPGASIAQASASANSIFRNGLEAQYGALSLSDETRKELLNQRLKLSPAANGASSARGQFTDPIQVLMVVVSMVLLIACANLANLLLARGALRQREIALRLSLGADRFRLIRQLLTESLLLATAGGIAGLAVAYMLHTILVQMVKQADSGFRVSFSLDPKVLLFTFGLSFAAALLFGLLPALSITKQDTGSLLKEQGRGSAGGSAGRMRWGRMLVGLQIALSLPLLLGAGLLLRTITNLQNVEFGYRKDNLLLMRIDTQTAGYDPVRSLPVFRELLDRIRKTPGVVTASFSENGLFSGHDSGDEILVEGYTRKGSNDRGTRWDQVGPNYFSSLGVRMIQGREILESDREGSVKVCVINEAFAKRFFEGRNPIGMHITTVYAQRRVTHEIVGVAQDHRTHRLRGDIPTRNFVPITQPLGDAHTVVFEIRTGGAPTGLVQTIRNVVRSYDPNIPVVNLETMEEKLSGRLATDRMTAQLAATLGLAAVILAAIGLYGVLSYGVAWRRTEIGVRMALGAHPMQVIRMIIRETGLLVAIGLALGVLLAFGSGKLLASQLFGLSPQDPATFTAAILLLGTVALLAAFLPAWRASRVDPIVALRQD
jgi:predicted permease